MFLELFGLGKKSEQRITESLTELLWELYSGIWVEELLNRNCFGIDSVTFLCLMDRYDWTTGAPRDGNEWKKYRAVPRVHPSRALLYACFNRSGSKEPFSFPGATWDRFRCTVEPLARSDSVTFLCVMVDAVTGCRLNSPPPWALSRSLAFPISRKFGTRT